MKRKKRVVRSDGAVFQSTQEAAASVFGDQTNISAACRGKRKSAYGYKWRYEGESEKTYALYKNDEFVMLGTAQELAERMGCKVETVRWYACPSAMERLKNRKRGGYWVEVVDEWPEQE